MEFPRRAFGRCLFCRGLSAFGGLIIATAVADGVRTKDLLRGRFIPATDACFRYEGRLDTAGADGPVVIWEGSRISLDFTGTQLALKFADAVGQNYFNVEVDDEPAVIVSAPAGGESLVACPPLKSGRRHRLVLFKRSEASAGHVRFAGVEISPKAQVWAPPAPDYRLRMIFFGDSITVGACNEDGAADQWENRRTHNHALSYSTLTAAALQADYRCIAVSGMGIATGYVPVKAGEVWDRLYPAADSARADPPAWQPDVVCINFGENDDSFSRGHGQPFPAGYVPGYVALVKSMRIAYPKAHFVLLRGGMYGGAKSEPLRMAWDEVMARVETDDPNVGHFAFSHWTETHPRVKDDRAMAEELISWLRQQSFMRRFL